MYRLAFKQADLKEIVAVLNAYDVAVEKRDIELVCKCDEVTIHKDGTVTLTCEDGYICYKERPTAHELYGKYKPVI